VDRALALLDLVDEAFDRKSWHGTNLRGAIRGVSAALAALRAGRLSRPVGAERYPAAFLIRGVAAHDLYHAGQIQLLKKLTPDA
jgi:hypothetical protein